MKNEYAIIDLSDYREKLEELRGFVGSRKPTEAEYAKMQIYSTLIAESTPLIPVIEKAFDAGSYNHHSQHTEEYDNDKQTYINNLKLDI